MSVRKKHVIVERRRMGGFQPERWIICRCGWQSDHHYNAGHVTELFQKHKDEANDD